MRRIFEWFFVACVCLFLIAVSLPNFTSCGGDGRPSSVKANAHTIQTMVETYAVDWKGEYPNNINNLKLEASKNAVNKYWKELQNPYTKLTGKGNAYDDFDKKLLEKEDGWFFNRSPNKGKAGCVYYYPIFDKTGKIFKYYIYASGKDGFWLTDNGTSFFALTNS